MSRFTRFTTAVVIMTAFSLSTVFPQSKQKKSIQKIQALGSEKVVGQTRQAQQGEEKKPLGTSPFIGAVMAPIVLNEFYADPAPGGSGDANRDGIRHGSQDEFVEFVNTGADTVDISNWVIRDADVVRHIFAPNTKLDPGRAVVIFGGGVPTGDFGGSLVVTASRGLLGLNNTGDTITLFNAMNQVAAQYRYRSEANANQSLARDPDLTGSFKKHSQISDAGRALFSPGTRNDGSFFVEPPNVAPVLAFIGDTVLFKGQLIEFSVSASDENNDPLTFSAENLPAGATFLNQVFSWTPTESGFFDKILFRVEDDRGGFAEELISIDVLDSVLLVLNEFLADPGAGLSGDANGDGVRNGAQDEFVEIVNTGETDIDIGGMKLWDASSERHIFAIPTVLRAGGAVVVFSGGSPTGSFGGAIVVTASGGFLGLNNGGDTIKLVTRENAVIFSHTYGAEGNMNQSLNRDPDLTGNFVAHASIINANDRLFSPGTRSNGRSFARSAENIQPVLVPIGNKELFEGNALTFAVSANDADDDPLVFSAANLPAGATFTNQTFNWADPVVGVYTNVIFRVEDGFGGVDEENITITIKTRPNTAPILAQINDKIGLVGDLLNFTVTAVDAENDALSFSASNLPPGATFIGNTFSWDIDKAGVFQNVLFRVEDSRGAADEAHITIIASEVPGVATVILNEFLADPAPDNRGDANGDGITSGSQDEFLEFVNTGQDTIYLDNWTVRDADALRHTFPAGTSLLPGGAIVLFGGGSPVGSFGNATVNTASGGLLGLNNSGDTITLLDGSSQVMLQHTYADEAGIDQSLTRNPDIQGTFARHGEIAAANGALFSPGTRIDGTPFILPPNNSPAIATIGDKALFKGQLLQFSVSAIDPDGDVLTFSASNLPDGAIFVDKTFSWEAPETGVFSNILFRVEDERGGFAEESITITVLDSLFLVLNEFLADPAPDLSGDANGDGVRSSSQDEFVEIVNVGDTDIELGGMTLWDASSERHVFPAQTTLPAGGILVVFSGGTPTGSFGGALVTTASSGLLGLNNSGDTISLFTKEDATVFSYTYGPEANNDQSQNRDPDLTGPFASHAAIINANGKLFSPGTRSNGRTFDQAELNSAPILNLIGNREVIEGDTLKITLSATDVDNDILTFSAANLPAGATFVDSVFSWVTTQPGLSENILFRVEDGQGGSDEEAISITVNRKPNNAPVLSLIGDRVVMEGDTLKFVLTATDVDGDPLTFSAENLPVDATFVDSVFNWVAPFPGIFENIIFRVEDDRGGIDEELITITVNEKPNLAPVLTPVGNHEVTVGDTLVFAVTATEIEGDVLTFYAFNLPSGATFINNIFRWITTEVGTFENILFRVEDDRGGADQELISITVKEKPNTPPVLAEIGNQTVTAGDTLTFILTATDPDNDPLTFSAANLPAGATLVDSLFSWIAAGDSLYENIVFRVEDGRGGSDGETIFIRVNAKPNTAPILTFIGNRAVTEGDTLTFILTATDVDDDPLTFSAANLPAGATLTDSLFSWITTGTGLFENITFRVEDGRGGSDEETISITVNEKPNTAPILTLIGNHEVTEGDTLTFILTATDVDDDPLTFSAANLPAGATLTDSLFSWITTGTGLFENITFRVEDGRGGSDEETISITVNVKLIPNIPPVLAFPGNQVTAVGDTLSFSLSATDSDGDALQFYGENMPPGSTLDGQFFQLISTDAGLFNDVLFTVDDGRGGRDSAFVAITILGAPETRIVVINEFRLTPASENDIIDGSGADEPIAEAFIEFINTTASTVDLSSYGVVIDGTLRHVFPFGTTLEPCEPLLLTDAGENAFLIGGRSVSRIQIASSGNLTLQNSAALVLLEDPSQIIIDAVAFHVDSLREQSLVRHPELTGDFLPHNEIHEAFGASASPGMRTDGAEFKKFKLFEAGHVLTAAPENIGLEFRNLSWSNTTMMQRLDFAIQNRGTDPLMPPLRVTTRIIQTTSQTISIANADNLGGNGEAHFMFTRFIGDDFQLDENELSDFRLLEISDPDGVGFVVEFLITSLNNSSNLAAKSANPGWAGGSVPLARIHLEIKPGTGEMRVTHIAIEEKQAEVPRAFALHRNYPNPFNPATTIGYDVALPGHVTLKIFDIRGRHVVTLFNAYRAAGSYAEQWNGLDAAGRKVASGVYIAQMHAGRFHAMQKMLLSK